jgi:hypothetical protein
LSKLIYQKPPLQNIQQLYTSFNSPICEIDCGKKCRGSNPNDLPFCCDITQAIPALFNQEWDHLEKISDLWFPLNNPNGADHLDIPDGMVLRQCLGHTKCQRENRSLSCRQFPFFPYVSSNYEFLGLAFEWDFKDKCWLIDHADLVTVTYRQEFIECYDQMFIHYQDVFDNYQYHSELCREHYQQRGENFLVLHRNGKNYLIDPATEKKQRQP